MPMAKQQIYYRSNQGLRLKLTDANGEPLTLEDNDWKAKLYNTTSSDHLELSHSQDSGWVNCAPVPDAPGALYVDMANSTLLPGALKLAIEFADGAKCKFDLDVELTPYPVKNIEAAVEATLPIMQTSLKPLEDEIKKLRNSLKMATAGPKVLQRGLISIHAQPGVVYRNLGYVNLPVKTRESVDEYEYYVDADLNQISPGLLYYGGDASQKFISGDRNPDIIEFNVKYDPDTKRVKASWSLKEGNPNRLELHRTRIWLRAKVNDTAPYLMKGADGIIIGYHNSVIDPEPVPPRVRMFQINKPGKTILLDLDYILKRAVEDIRRLDIQILRHYQHGIPSTERVNSGSWDDFTSEGYPSGGYYKWADYRKIIKRGSKIAKKGLLRIRYSAGRRRRPSAWVVCAYDRTGKFEKPIVVVSRREIRIK